MFKKLFFSRRTDFLLELRLLRLLRSAEHVLGDHQRDRIADIRRALSAADVNRDKRLEFEEWRNEMKARGYAEEEIETMFAKYDTNGDRILDEDEQKALSNDLLRQNEAILREMNELNAPPAPVVESSNSSSSEFEKMTQRLDSLESSVCTILAKVETKNEFLCRSRTSFFFQIEDVTTQLDLTN